MTKISVIIPCFNAAQWVGEAVESALSQVGSDVEVLVVDDGSTDSSERVISSFGVRVTYLRQRNRGASAARNLGLSRAQGQFIQFLDADDVLQAGRFKILLAEWNRRSNIDFVSASFATFSGQLPSILQRLPETCGVVTDNALSVSYLPWAGLFDRTFIAKVGPWNEKLRIWEDLEFHARIFAQTKKFVHIPIPLYFYRQHASSRTSVYNSSRSRELIDFALDALLQTTEALVFSAALTPNSKTWLVPFYLHLSRRYAAFDDFDKFTVMMSIAREFSNRTTFKCKALAAQLFARAFGVRLASRTLELLLLPALHGDENSYNQLKED